MLYPNNGKHICVPCLLTHPTPDSQPFLTETGLWCAACGNYSLPSPLLDSVQGAHARHLIRSLPRVICLGLRVALTFGADKESSFALTTVETLPAQVDKTRIQLDLAGAHKERIEMEFSPADLSIEPAAIGWRKIRDTLPPKPMPNAPAGAFWGAASLHAAGFIPLQLLPNINPLSEEFLPNWPEGEESLLFLRGNVSGKGRNVQAHGARARVSWLD
jgi:hypothetical protein